MSENILREEERIAFELRALYGQYGYLPYKMSKFEEYDLYARNKEFLDGARIVTFNDVDGKLLALKPDITLSIIKNDADGGAKRKVYYYENVYRASKKTGAFKELQQVGVECIGDIDGYDVYETVCLAAESLKKISQNFVLDISHVGILSAVLQGIGQGKDFEKAVKRCLAEKSLHELTSLCESRGVSAEKLTALVKAYGKPRSALERLASVLDSEGEIAAFNEVKALCALLENTEYAENIRLDFSVTGSGNYYDSVVFNGFIDGVGESVLSGGRYDRLLARMGKKSGAIGFAVYLDSLENLKKTRRETDVDVVVLYDESVAVETLAATVQGLITEGYSVSAQKTQGTLRCKKYVDMRGGKQC
ncbi:MAG: ATP phosphoribosyltransferase regulatory subunit [Clostridia bacterium]|nr:ATP phosphoribosyltransferase regulatory subunit [Clostridia bacterium]